MTSCSGPAPSPDPSTRPRPRGSAGGAAALLLLGLAGPVAGGSIEVVDSEGRPVSGADVVVVRPAVDSGLLGRLAPPLIEKTTDAEGRTGSPLPALDRLLLTIDHPDSAPYIYQGPGTALDGPLVLAPGFSWEGQVAFEGAAPEGATVCARWSDEWPEWGKRRRWRRCTAVAETGEFLLRGLPDREIHVEIQAAGYLPLIAAWSPKEPAAALRPERGHLLDGRVHGRRAPVAGASVRSAEGARTATGEDGTFRIAAAALPVKITVQAEGFYPETVQIGMADSPKPLHIELTPRERIRGVLVGEQSLPVEEADVWVVYKRDSAAREEKLHRIASPEGHFRLDLPGPGRYQVRARAPGYRELRLPEIVLAAGETRSLGVLALSRGAVVRGTLRDAAGGEPLAGGTVELLPQGTPYLTALRSRNLPREVSGEDGTFSLSGLDGGRFELRAWHGDSAPATMRLTLEEGQHLDLDDVWIERGTPVRGRLLDRRGQPREGLEIRVFDPEHGSLSALAACFSAADGAFEGPRLAAGRYRLEVAGERLLLAQEIEVPRNAEDFELDLVVGGVDLAGVITRGSEPVPGGFLTLSAALDPGEQRGKVLLQAPGLAPARYGFSESTLTADVGSDGTFHVPDAPPGALWVRYMADDGSVVTRQVVVPDAPHHQVVIETGGHDLEGRVFDADSGAGLAEVRIRVVATSGTVLASTRSDHDGFFRVPELAPGTYELEAEAAGFRTAVHRLEVEAGMPPLPVPLESGDGGNLAIRLWRGDGSPAAGVPVTLLNQSGRMVRALLTDGLGARLYDDLPPGGYYLVWADPVAGTGASDLLQVDDGATLPFERRLPAGGSVEVACEAELCGGQQVDHLAVYSPQGIEIGPYLSGVSPALRFSPGGTLALGRLSRDSYLLRIWSNGSTRETAFTVSSDLEVVGLP